MCGIIGYAGYRTALPILIDSLKRLEYRGYDSAGVAVVQDGVTIVKDKGFIANLEAQLPDLTGVVGIGHTRWATHGPPSKANSHPFSDCTGKIALAHNGIIENYVDLRDELKGRGHTFVSQTDTEVIVHLVEEAYRGDLAGALREALARVTGTFAILAVHANEPDRVVAARNFSPLVVGLGTEENYLASDVPALLKHTDRVLYVMDREIVAITAKTVHITDLEGRAVAREPQRISWTVEDAERGGFEHFMLKEIFEQPQAIHNTLLGRMTEVDANGFFQNGFTSLKLVACGTSYHAALIGKYILEEVARMPTTVELASEYRYAASPAERPLVILISQSGETADTLGAAREAKRRGCKTLGITNIVGSSLTREADRTMYTRAGLEIGVAATKTFTAQVVALYLVAIRMGLDRQTLDPEEANRLRDDLRALPRHVQTVLNQADKVEEIARMHAGSRDMFFIGRGINYPVAMEAALKMKEISYIHAEAYAGGELKHGPLALLTPETPVIAVVPRDRNYEKMMSNVGEVNARGAPVVAVGAEGDKELARAVDHVLSVPRVRDLLYPVAESVLLQLFAYYTARKRGCAIDKPRNLAKTVTVE
ncbi:MAG TPA: glutamine--fructose-6-phosphate transaminase (isomerizing) [Thermoplasmata archaeon]|jgi:glucosamine--fructose-6-phosphate aminotransferase (isomerizing)|nr:glutamine--fructose-6-phosphate transaminase (isomerizing) [Thermoplasmata archaeon]